MAEYIYTARNQEGKIYKGRMPAKDDADLANILAQSGYFLTSFKLLQASAPAVKSGMPRLKQKEVLRFTFQCATLLNAGLPLLESLSELAGGLEDSAITAVVKDIQSRIEKGASFKEALMAHPKSFSRLYIGIIGAGEASGKLDQAMNDLGDLLEWQMGLTEKVKQAATYPAILSVAMVGTVTLLVVKVIPAFEPIFKEVGTALPLPTQIVLAISHFVRDFWLLIAGMIAGIIFVYKSYNNTPDGHCQLDRIKLRMPLVGTLFHKLALTRFTRTLAICFNGGIPILQAMDIAKDTCGNDWITRSVTKAKDFVNIGDRFATALQASGEFPSLVLRMISIGEQTGTLPKTLFKVSEYYDKEVNSTIKRVTVLMEPILIVIMGVVVGLIALAIFMPMFRISDLIGK